MACDAKTVDFKVNAALHMDATLSVHDYYSSYRGVSNDGTAALNVYGTFTPTTSYFYGCTMQDGSTVDLSGKTDTWSTTSSSSNNNTVKFADNATVKIKLGNRAVSRSTPVVSWTTAPGNLAGLTFKPAEGENFRVIKKSDAEIRNCLDVTVDGLHSAGLVTRSKAK